MDYEICNEDCLEGMKRLADNSVDCIVTDLPYNLTACAWDHGVIDLAAFWEQVNRVLKPCCSAVMFSSGKFTHKLIASNFERYKYKWIWVKNAPTMFVQAKNAPMRKFEEICIFSDGSINHPSCTNRRMKYNPQGVVPCVIDKNNAGKVTPTQLVAGFGVVRTNSTQSQVTAYGGKLHRNNDYLANGELKSTQLRSPFVHNTDKVSDVSLQGGRLKGDVTYHCTADWVQRNARKNFGGLVGQRPSNVAWYIQEQTGYPTDVLEFKAVANGKRLHPTQKPVDLLEFLIKTYTDEGEVVLDATMGSGSTGVAAINTGRKFIGFELEEKFFNIARERLEEAAHPSVQPLF